MSNPQIERKKSQSDSFTTLYSQDSPMSMRSPLRWFGGKGVISNRIIKFFPPHTNYVEVFGGGASLLFRKRPSPIETYNDINKPLYNFFLALKDPTQFQPLLDAILITPYSRELFYDTRSRNDLMNPLDFYILNRQGFGGNNDTYSWSFAVKQSAINMSAATSKWLTTNQSLIEHHKRLQNVTITNLDFREVLETHRDPSTLIYLDPPYIPSTRKSGSYNDEMSLRDHLNMLSLIKETPSMVVLSGYPNPHYSILSNWQQIDFAMPCFAVGRVRGSGTLGKGGLADHKRTEAIWINQPTIKALNKY